MGVFCSSVTGGGVLLLVPRLLLALHTTEEDIPVRSFVTAVAAWGREVDPGLSVSTSFSQDEAVVRNIGIKHTELGGASQFESKHDSGCTPSGLTTTCVTRSPLTSSGMS